MDQRQGVRQFDLATGVFLSYVSSGPVSGTPVLLLHAWGESRRSFDRLLPLLPVTIHAMAMDQRGHGDSGQPKVGYSLEDFAEDIVAFMDVAGISSAVLVGSSSGGYVAQQVAATSPRRVDGLVLVGSPLDLQGRPPFADEIDQLSDPLDPDWVRQSMAWFPRFHPVPQWYIDDRVPARGFRPDHLRREPAQVGADRLTGSHCATSRSRLTLLPRSAGGEGVPHRHELGVGLGQL